jgi:hypothetical protein
MRDNMKKVLLGTSAIALAGAFATQASAAEWEVHVGGYMEQYLAFASSDFDDGRDGDWDGVDSKQDAEIHFLPSITLDNGLKIGVNVQLEAFQNGDQIDESYMFIKGSFGEINLGSENSAGYKMQYAAPDVTFVNVNSGSLGSFIPISSEGDGANDLFRGTLGSTYTENLGNNDAQRFTYYTPRFAGFQVGVSYARDGFQDTNAQVNTDEGISDIFDIGANYVQSFGDFNVAVSGRYGTASAPGPNPDVWNAGLNVGFAGFTVGGSYAVQNDGGTASGRAWDAGVSYETGPWGFSFTYFNGRSRDNTGTVNIDGSLSSETNEQYLVGVSYAMAKGVTLNAFGAFVDFDESSPGENADGDVIDGSVDGWVIGTGIKVSF